MSVLEYKRALLLEDESRRRRRAREREAEIKRLEAAERQAIATAPEITVSGRHVLPWAAPLQRPARYKGASGGRGRGASHFFAEEAVQAMVDNPALRFACVREVQKALKYSAKSLIESKIRALGVTDLFDVLETEIRRRDHDGVMIFEGMQDHTAESIKSLEGFGRAWVEEAHNISKKSLAILLPTIRAPQSEIWFSWNPELPTDPVDALFVELERQQRVGEIPAGRFVHARATYKDNPLCPDELLQEAERSQKSDADAYEHIWMGGYFLGGHGRVYSSFVNRPFPAGNIDESVRDLGGDLYVGQDFNVNPMASVIAVRVVDECHVIDALEIPTSNTDEVAAEIKRRYPPVKDAWGNLVPRRIIFCPDPAGNQRHTNAPVGQTDFTILQGHGFEVRAPSTHPPVADRINNAQRMYFDPELNRRRIRINPKASALITGLSNLTYKEGTSAPNKKSGFDHICDAMDYLLWSEFCVVQDPPQKWGQSKSGLYGSSGKY
jgi:PBSX family phage terminase large subunit